MGSELIEYTGILHGSGVGSRAAADFRMRLSGDPDFLRRAAVIDRLFLLRDNLGDHRRAWPTPAPLTRCGSSSPGCCGASGAADASAEFLI